MKLCVNPWLKDLCGAICDQHDQCYEKQHQPHRPREAGGEHLPPMPAVEFGTYRHFGLVLGFDSLLLVPPRAAAVEVVSDI